jgi:anti-anti-sigma factor
MDIPKFEPRFEKTLKGDQAVFTFNRIDRISVKNANRFKFKVLRSVVNPKVRHIIIDLDGLEFMDTYGAEVLVTLRKFARKKQKKFYLKNLSDEFKEIIDLLKLENDFRIL